MNVRFYITMFCFLPIIALAQMVDTTFLLPAAKVEIHRSFTLGSQQKNWGDSVLKQIPSLNLADFLQQKSNIYIKSYGQGSAATSSIRGASASHTLVLWNDLPLQNPSLGLMDLSLIPTQGFNQLQLTRGGNSAMWGSGAIGGVLRLSQKADFERQFGISFQAENGSFGYSNVANQLVLGNSWIQFSSQIQIQEAKNDFSYTPAPGLVELKQQNARFLQLNSMQNLYIKISKAHQLSVHYWGNLTDRQIPPTLVQNNSEATQEDQANRYALRYQWTLSKSLLKVNIGYYEEQLDYLDEQIRLSSNSNFNSLIADIQYQYHWKKHSFLLGNTYSKHIAESNGFGAEIPEEERQSVWLAWDWKAEKWHHRWSIRQAFVEGDAIPLVAEVAFDYQFQKHWKWKGKISRNYRLPSLNDRFWRPGGNMNLNPEQGWSQETSINYQKQLNHFKLTSSQTFFNRHIQDWIWWTRQEGAPFFSPYNIASVWSRGWESRLKIIKTYQYHRLALDLGYDFIKSTNQVSIQQPNIEKGEQLIYTPKHQGYASFSWQHRSFQWSYRHQFVGAALGNSDTIDAFQLGDFNMSYHNSNGPFNGSIYVQVRNLWDSDYVIIERRPMPGRQIIIGIQFQFQK